MKQASKQANAEPEQASGTVAEQAIVDTSREADDATITLADDPPDPEIRLPEPLKDSDYATFRSLRAKDLWVTLKPADMIEVKRPDGSTVKVKAEVRGQYPDAPFTAKFSMGTFRTNNKHIIIGMLNAEQFGVGFGIDAMDPTGYWRRHNIIKEREVREVRFDVERDPNAIRMLTGAIGFKDTREGAGA